MMLQWLSDRTKMFKLSGKWSDATRLDPGDNGQIAMFASDLMKQYGLRAEDAWVTALGNWMYHHPVPEMRMAIASGILRFLDIYAHTMAVSSEVRQSVGQLAADTLVAYMASDLPSEPKVEGSPPSRQLAPASVAAPAPPAVFVRPAQPSEPVGAPIYNKNELFLKALDFLVLELFAQDYKILLSATSRADAPSIIVEKKGVKFFVQMEASVYPACGGPGQFMIDRCKAEAKEAGAYTRIARVMVSTASVKSGEAKGVVKDAVLHFEFNGLESG